MLSGTLWVELTVSALSMLLMGVTVVARVADSGRGGVMVIIIVDSDDGVAGDAVFRRSQRAIAALRSSSDMVLRAVPPDLEPEEEAEEGHPLMIDDDDVDEAAAWAIGVYWRRSSVSRRPGEGCGCTGVSVTHAAGWWLAMARTERRGKLQQRLSFLCPSDIMLCK